MAGLSQTKSRGTRGGILLGPGIARQAKRITHGGKQFVEVDWLFQVVHSTVAHGTDRVANVRIRRDEEQRDSSIFRADPVKHIETGHSGHAHVADDHAEPFSFKASEGFLAACRRLDRESVTGQKTLEKLALGRVVVDNQQRGQFVRRRGPRRHAWFFSSLERIRIPRIRNAAPPRSLAPHSISQWCARTICFTTARPSPLPWALVVK
jgi:hypothetical protein